MESLSRPGFVATATLSRHGGFPRRSLRAEREFVPRGLVWQQLGARQSVRVLRRAVDSGFWRRNRCGGGCFVRARAGGDEEGGNGGERGENGNESGGAGDKSDEGDGAENDGIAALRNALARGSARYYSNLVNASRSELGVDINDVVDKLKVQSERVKEVGENVVRSSMQRAEQLREEVEEAKKQSQEAVAEAKQNYWPRFVEWNRWELWKDVRSWNAQRLGALLLFGLLLGASGGGVYSIVGSIRNRGAAEKIGETFLEAAIPEPTPENLQKLKKGMWRQEMPEGFRAIKYVKGPDGEYKRDPNFVGENAWDDDENENENEPLDKLVEEGDLNDEEKAELLEILNVNRAAKGLPPLNSEFKEEKPENENDSLDNSNDLIAGAATGTIAATEAAPLKSWEDRLEAWEELIEKENLKDMAEEENTKYEYPVDTHELSENLAEEQEELEVQPKKKLAFWVSRRWWKYRPKIPYTYFMSKVENLEVAAAVYSCDMKKLYVTMKDGFPSEYVVDIPVDPYLYEALTRCGVETDILAKSNFEFYGRAFLSLLPTVLIVLCIRALQYRTKEIFSEKIYDLLRMNRKHLILPEDAADKAKSQYKDVVVGGDVWMVLEEIMTYMRNPLKYYNQKVKLPRGILISGPPGTGKTLLARAIARESGLPFVFASGAEFVESNTGNGSDKIFDIFFTARANAPSFVFIDEIDALAGKNVNDDAERRATFQQLLAELDGEPDDTDVDRWSSRQAVILICATNRPDELDESFLRPGRIDREIHIGLPGEEERVSIFGVHSSGRPLAKDLDFRKLVYRTLGYSGADIRNLINEAAIMAVRNGHEEITQQDLIDVLDKQLFEGMGVSLTADELQRTQATIPMDNKRLLAVHEAGHILLAHLFPQFDWHAFSHLLPGGSEYALTVFYPREEMVHQGHTTVGYLRMQMVVAHGGRCAERILFGDNVSDGGQDDLQKISGIARELTISLSNNRFGLFPMKWQETLDPPKRPDETDLIPNEWDKPGSQIVGMSTEFSELFTREVTKYIDETEEQAMEALRKNEHILRRLTEELLTKTKLSGFEAEDLIRSMDPIMMPDPLADPMVPRDAEERLGPSIDGRYKEMVLYPAPLHRC
ncbi:hypothetical protein KC19_3G168900 [Ceratodon purpureus]|uniref:AAA+ ATPase domain-containing protein n=1 Tax=Ceratodon purpureus TaxID=3225 RepID=A0A8T0IM41_CERPU|nr:hypothetical protein KC19_3G168900 [Ceratodon purpureus]KAG0583887.1 hypothetical protein KC19_3G168900 [Ceratodon purpureus]